MKLTYKTLVASTVIAYLTSSATVADDISGAKPIRADTHAPIGVMLEHTHNAGEWMFSYRFMRMDMNGNQIGHRSVSPDEIVTTVENIFGPPPTLRVVPTEMTTEMQMFGAMYAPNDRWTLMLMLNHLNKEMDHVTYMGMAGTAVLGGFTTKSTGWGDTTVAGMLRLRDEPDEKWHLNIGISLPTGDIEEKDNILTPMGMTPTVRLPYPMQLGSGTYDLKPGITYNGRADKLTWGAQYTGIFRMGENDEDYTLGDIQTLTAWTAYSPKPALSFSARLEYRDVDRIDGQDPAIALPVQTANPDFQGGESLLAYIGVNYAAQSDNWRGHRIALEYGGPLSQNLNGPQMKMDDMLTVGWQYSF